MDKAALGRYGEEVAEEYLKEQGYKIIARNYKTRRWGEIDRIAVYNDTLVFVEVRTRTGDDFMTPQETVTPHKVHSLKRAANYFYLSSEAENLPQALRIDLVAVTLNIQDKSEPTIEHFENITS